MGSRLPFLGKLSPRFVSLNDLLIFSAPLRALSQRKANSRRRWEASAQSEILRVGADFPEDAGFAGVQMSSFSSTYAERSTHAHPMSL